MAAGRTSNRMKDQIIELKARGYSQRAIIKALHVSRHTIRKALGESPVPVEIVGDDWVDKIPWGKISHEVNVRGVTVKQLHAEYCPEVSYTTFWRVVWQRCLKSDRTVTLRLDHPVGERTQVDFTDGLYITDRITGVRRKTHLFTGVLAFSSYTYAEFCLDQRQPTFMSLQERMWHYFDGVTKYLVTDNLKAAVTTAHRYDPDVNQTYVEFANHWGFAVLAARPYHPKDKAKNESHNNVFQRTFFQEVRDRTFFSVDELNRCFWEFLKGFNNRIMKDHGVSRSARFAEEKNLLLPLAVEDFSRTEWKLAKVHPDCHIQVMKNFYSVPYSYVGQTDIPLQFRTES